MSVFITGTDTHIGKTLASAWLCLHADSDYFKPIQTGSIEGTDSTFVAGIIKNRVHPESYLFKAPESPHTAAQAENSDIDITTIKLPAVHRLVVEGAGGLMVPLNREHLMIDLAQALGLPVLLVASTKLGTLNHTLLSLEALHARQMPVAGIILNGPGNPRLKETLEHFGQSPVLAEIPPLDAINTHSLQALKPGPQLLNLFNMDDNNELEFA